MRERIIRLRRHIYCRAGGRVKFSSPGGVRRQPGGGGHFSDVITPTPSLRATPPRRGTSNYPVILRMPPLLFPSPHGGAAVKDGECPEIKIIIHQLNFELCTLKIEKTSDNGCFFVIARGFLHLGGNWPVRYAVPLPTGAEFGAVRRHPGAGRDPVDALRQPVSFDIITQVLRSAKLDTARPRYDELPHQLRWSPPSFLCWRTEKTGNIRGTDKVPLQWRGA